MEIAASMIRTPVIVSISNDDKHYTTVASLYIYIYIYMYICIYIPLPYTSV